MKKLLALLALLGAIFAPSFAFAQTSNTGICVNIPSSPLGISQNNCVPVTSANPLPVTSSGGGTTTPLTDVACGSAVSSCVLKATPGNLFGVYANCTSACWLMLFNSVAAPSNGATTAGKASGNMVECIPIAANGTGSITYPTYPIGLSVGITAAISSTACATLTLSTVAFIHGTFQ